MIKVNTEIILTNGEKKISLYLACQATVFRLRDSEIRFEQPHVLEQKRSISVCSLFSDPRNMWGKKGSGKVTS